ncbi:MAG: hypothetical protein ABEJ28_07690 [Salinigranum sp.]
MVTELGWTYLGGLTVLFFFWAYGIASFVLDLKNKLIPGARRYLRGRRRLQERAEREKEREERERELL